MKIGIFGGTFNPLHNGHIKLAEASIEEIGLNKLFFVPNYVSPFKVGDIHANCNDRIAMIKSILKYNKAFDISTYEIDHEVVSYTINMLDYMQDRYKEDSLYFIVGFDALLTLDTWYQGESILSKFNIISAIRPPYDDECTLAKLNEYRLRYSAQISILNAQMPDISSSMVRSRIQSNGSIDNLVPLEIKNYIYEQNLYQN